MLTDDLYNEYTNKLYQWGYSAFARWMAKNNKPLFLTLYIIRNT